MQSFWKERGQTLCGYELGTPDAGTRVRQLPTGQRCRPGPGTHRTLHLPLPRAGRRPSSGQALSPQICPLPWTEKPPGRLSGFQLVAERRDAPVSPNFLGQIAGLLAYLSETAPRSPVRSPQPGPAGPAKLGRLKGLSYLWSVGGHARCFSYLLFIIINMFNSRVCKVHEAESRENNEYVLLKSSDEVENTERLIDHTRI